MRRTGPACEPRRRLGVIRAFDETGVGQFEFVHAEYVRVWPAIRLANIAFHASVEGRWRWWAPMTPLKTRVADATGRYIGGRSTSGRITIGANKMTAAIACPSDSPGMIVVVADEGDEIWELEVETNLHVPPPRRPLTAMEFIATRDENGSPQRKQGKKRHPDCSSDPP